MSYVTKEPGDISFTQYAVVSTHEVHNAVDIVKGHCYTPNTGGRLHEIVSSSGIINNVSRGIFQAMTKSDAVSGESAGDRSVQCLGLRSRIILKASAANLVPGQPVELHGAAQVEHPAHVQALTSTGTKIGVIYKIFGDKLKTAIDDKLYVEVFY